MVHVKVQRTNNKLPKISCDHIMGHNNVKVQHTSKTIVVLDINATLFGTLKSPLVVYLN